MKIKETDIRRLTLKGWAAIDDLRRTIDNLAQEGKWWLVPDIIFQVIEIGCSRKIPKILFWIDVIKIYNQILERNQPTKLFPILTSKEKGKPLPWEYEGRSWYFWLNLFGDRYGWDEEQISKLEVDTAIGLYQEIVIDDQLRNEWDWGLSEVSRGYDSSSKKSVFHPLPRPDWMRPIAPKRQAVKTVKMPAGMIPSGNVVALDEIDTIKETHD